MCEGPLLWKIIVFTVPLICSGILQLLFNAADMIVVGRFAGKEALAAVGSTSALNNLLINLFMGLSIGANVLISRYYGAGREEDMHQTVQTSVAVSLIGGVFLAVLGNIFAKPLLHLMGSPDDVIGLAVLYMRIIFAGMPAFLVYNYGSAILRAVGDTKRPLFFLGIAGVMNVLLNLLFVIGLQLSVAGVALATTISQCVSAVLMIRWLCRLEGGCHLEIRRLSVFPDKLKNIIRYGLPAGIQSSIFAFSNVMIQSSVNSFGSVAMAGASASSNLENFVYTSMNAFQQSALCFTSQNLGGGKYDRINKVLCNCLLLVFAVGVCMGGGFYLFGNQLLGIFSPDPEVIAYGIRRMKWICVPYFLCGMMDVMVGQLRGLGYAVVPMCVSV
ncbi:MAG: MATE family efflux transporter, partial [Lachnospiraceae bacterium]